MSVAIKIENVSKLYRLGTVGTGTIAHDLNRWWHTIRGKEDPYAKVGQVNDRTKAAARSEKLEKASDSSETLSPLASSISSLRSSAPDYVWALRDINLEVAQGEILGIIGRNGAGKSTLLKLLSRVTAPTTGSIKTKGRIASLLEVGTGFHPEMTGRENIYMNGAILGMRRHEITRQLDEIVEFSGCAKYLDTPVKRYSSGMTVRLAFAIAAHLQCEILVVDEVLAVGDAEFQAKSIGKMQTVSKSGRTVLFVSHQISALRRLCSSGILLSNGTVSQRGNINDALEAYLNSPKLASVDRNIRDIPRPEWATSCICEATLLSEESTPCNSIAQGSTLRLRMQINFAAKPRLVFPVIGVVLKNRMDEIVAVLNTKMTGTSFTHTKDREAAILCEIASPPLIQGQYKLDLWLADSHENVDVVYDAVTFNVHSADVYKSGVDPDAAHGAMYLSATWQLLEGNKDPACDEEYVTAKLHSIEAT